MPGQWEPIYVPKTYDSAPSNYASAAASLFTTLARIPTTLGVNLFNVARRVIENYTYRQQIQAVPILRADGARKKILLDAGRKQTASAHRKTSTSPRNGLPDLWVPTLYDGTSNHLRQVHTETDETPWGSVDHESSRASPPLDGLQPLSVRATKNIPATKGSVSTHLMHTNHEADANSWTPAASDTLPVKIVKSSRIASLQEPPCASLLIDSHLSKLPITSSAPVQCPDIFQKIDYTPPSVTGSDYVAHLELTPTGKTRTHPQQDQARIFDASQISSEDGTSSSPSSPFGFLTPGPSLIKHRRIHELSKVSAGRAKRPTPKKTTFTEEYSNDESYLPDVPTPLPRRRCTWAKEAKVQEFYQNLAIDEMLDSTLEDIRSSPNQRIEYTSEDEMSLSIEVLQEIQQLVLASPQKPLTPAESEMPLIPDLDETDEDKLSTMLQITANGMKQCDVLETRLKTHDFQTLLPGEFNGNPLAWLNDNIVNEYLSILVDHQKAASGYKHVRGGAAPPLHAFASQWYSSASKNLKSVARWASKKQLGGQQLLDAKLLLIPVCEGGHWRLVAIKPQDRSLEYLDSLGFDGSKIMKTAVSWLQQELGEHWRGEEWSVVEKQRSVEQLNGSDCGVFTCLNALALVRGEEPSRVKAFSGMHEARRRIAVTLFSRQPTGEL